MLLEYLGDRLDTNSFAVPGLKFTSPTSAVVAKVSTDPSSIWRSNFELGIISLCSVHMICAPSELRCGKVEREFEARRLADACFNEVKPSVVIIGRARTPPLIVTPIPKILSADEALTRVVLQTYNRLLQITLHSFCVVDSANMNIAKNAADQLASSSQLLK